MRARFVALAVLLGAGALPAGCSGNAGFDNIEAHGSLADGASINARNLASTAIVPSLLPALGVVEAVGAPFNGPEDLRGFRIEFQEASITAGSSYPSDPNGPVVFYFSFNTPDAGVNDEDARAVNGGLITFNTVGTTSGAKTTGALAGLVLSRGGVTIATVDAGFFQATHP
jgi:hypothetical protein